MGRTEILQLLEGTHPRHGRRLALFLDGLIVVSAIAIALETLPDLPRTLRASLFAFEIFIVFVFAAEYFIRLFSSPKPLRYALSFWGIVDILAWLPAILMFVPAFQAIRVLRLMRLLRLIKLFNTAPALARLMRAFSQVRSELVVWAVLSTLLLYVSAVGIYIFEHPVQPEIFSSIPASLWWSVVSFTTVGYGDMYPVTGAGRILTTFMLFIGLGIFAVPAAIVTTALLEAETTLNPRDDTSKNQDESKKGD